MEKRVYNFSPGPAVLPLPALEEAQRDLLALPGTGISILEISHRSKKFDADHRAGRGQPPHAAGHPRQLPRALPPGRGPAAVRHGPA